MQETRTLNVTAGGFIFYFYSASGEFDILTKQFEIETETDQNLAYNTVSYTLGIQRLSAVYWFSILIPVMLNSYLIPIVFLLPPASGEKMGFGLTVMLSFVVILTIVADGLSPSSKTTSLLEVYIMLVLFMSVFSVLFTCVVVLFYNKPEDEVPGERLRRLAAAAERLLCWRQSEDKAEAADCPTVSSPENSGEGVKQDSYQQRGQVMDDVLLVVYCVFTSVFTVVFLMAIAITPSTQDLPGSSVY